jgi:hypothetical protein
VDTVLAMSDSLQSDSQSSAFAGIAKFWSWWETARPEVEAAIAADDFERVEPDLSQAVNGIDPGLEWEIGGPDGRELVITAAGEPALRSAAARWLLAAPRDRRGWGFHATRQPDPAALSMVLVVDEDDTEVALDGMSVAIVEDQEALRLHLTVHHDGFATLEEGQRLHIASMVLDWVLGEQNVERWVGEVAAVTERPQDAIAVADVPKEVADFAAWHPRSYVLIQGEVDGQPLTGIVHAPLSPVDFPLFGQHIAVAVPYTTMTADRLQTGVSAQRMEAFDDALSELLGADAVFAAAVSRDGVRVFHFYTDPAGDVVERLGAWRHGWLEGPVDIRATHDPAWREIRPFQL